MLGFGVNNADFLSVVHASGTFEYDLCAGLESGKYFEPTVENCLSGDYPIARFLYVYVNKKPDQPLDKLTQEFINFVLSKEGQEIVVKDGYYPLPATVVEKHVVAAK